MLSYLLNSHHNLNGIQAVQTEVVREVSSGLDLYYPTNIMSVESVSGKQVGEYRSDRIRCSGR